MSRERAGKPSGRSSCNWASKAVWPCGVSWGGGRGDAREGPPAGGRAVRVASVRARPAKDVSSVMLRTLYFTFDQ